MNLSHYIFCHLKGLYWVIVLFRTKTFVYSGLHFFVCLAVILTIIFRQGIHLSGGCLVFLNLCVLVDSVLVDRVHSEVIHVCGFQEHRSCWCGICFDGFGWSLLYWMSNIVWPGTQHIGYMLSMYSRRKLHWKLCYVITSGQMIDGTEAHDIAYTLKRSWVVLLTC